MFGVCFRGVNLSSFFYMACATSFCLVCRCSVGRYVCELQAILAFSLAPMCALEDCLRVSISQDMNSPSCAAILACSLSLWMWMLESLKKRAAKVLRGSRKRPKAPIVCSGLLPARTQIPCACKWNLHFVAATCSKHRV